MCCVPGCNLLLPAEHVPQMQLSLLAQIQYDTFTYLFVMLFQFKNNIWKLLLVEDSSSSFRHQWLTWMFSMFSSVSRQQEEEKVPGRRKEFGRRFRPTASAKLAQWHLLPVYNSLVSLTEQPPIHSLPPCSNTTPKGDRAILSVVATTNTQVPTGTLCPTSAWLSTLKGLLTTSGTGLKKTTTLKQHSIGFIQP